MNRQVRERGTSVSYIDDTATSVVRQFRRLCEFGRVCHLLRSDFRSKVKLHLLVLLYICCGFLVQLVVGLPVLETDNKSDK